ncbi:hypothetical protein KSP40_PGU021801 [Platanthera guangdongensis]|uniref:ABC transporter domain-containing protein n=1 Tax=Platanthera guangdongensis TaxID=2320717 RepID=A0ABR2N1L4_9ASPA
MGDLLGSPRAARLTSVSLIKGRLRPPTICQWAECRVRQSMDRRHRQIQPSSLSFLPGSTLDRRQTSSSAYSHDMPTVEDLINVLKAVRLGDILTRFQGLDSMHEWSSVLSLGEQQRLAFARLLLAKPKLIFLDESTSALDEANESVDLFGAAFLPWLDPTSCLAERSSPGRSILFRPRTSFSNAVGRRVNKRTPTALAPIRSVLTPFVSKVAFRPTGFTRHRRTKYSLRLRLFRRFRLAFGANAAGRRVNKRGAGGVRSVCTRRKKKKPLKYRFSNPVSPLRFQLPILTRLEQTPLPYQMKPKALFGRAGAVVKVAVLNAGL